jgi:hypothetical protein
MGATGKRLPAQDGEDNHLFGAAFLEQDACAFVCGRTGCEDIIHQQDGSILHGSQASFVAAETESARQVGLAVRPVEKGLLARKPDAAKNRRAPEVALASQRAGDFVSLVEPAPSVAPPMQGDRNKDPRRVRLGRDAWVLQSFLREKGELAVEVDLASILVGMHEFESLLVGAGRRSRKLEVVLVPPAPGTQDILRNNSLDVHPALHAEWFLDSREAVTA